jgi:DNA-binding transcriptional regulator LsrR (DeoR family)
VSDAQLQVRVAWLYYMENKTQAEIAERLGLTRLRVKRMIAEARESGLVSITLSSRLESCIALEQELCRAVGLRDAVIVPTPDDPELISTLLGRAAADYLARHLEENRVTGLGIGWGATLRETIRHLRPGRYPEMSVNSMMGGLTRGFELNTFEITSELARRLGAQCNYLAAPIYAGSPKSRDTILAQDVFRETFQRIAENEVALLSVGDLTRRSLLIRYGLPADVSVQELRAAGAVGDVMGQFLDAAGRPIAHALNRRAIGLPLDALSRIGTVIVASGGANKTRIVAAILRARLAGVLVCDERTASAALELLRGDG